MAASGTWENSLVENSSGTWSYSDSKVLTISGSGEMPDFTAPMEGQPWVDCLEDVTSINVQYGITKIGNYCFANSVTLETLVLPSSVTVIGESAFYYSGVFSVLAMPGIVEIGDRAFCGSTYKYISFPETLRTIGAYAFSQCGAESVDLPNGVETIGERAFYNNAIASIHIPASVKEIGSKAFEQNKLTSITNDSPYYSVIYNALFDSGATTLLQYPQSDTRTKFTIPDSVTTLADRCFAYSENLQEVYLTSNVKTIGEYAFMHCDSLSSIEIPGSVTKIGRQCFGSCNSLNSVVLQEGITEIAAAMFFACESLSEISIPDSVTKIGDQAFQSSGLTEITIPGSVGSGLGQSVFSRCTSLETVNVCKGVTLINFTDFANCDVLFYLTLPNTITEIRGSAFKNSGIAQLTLLARTPPTIGTNILSGTAPRIVVPYGCGETYKTADGWIEYEDRIYEGASLFDLKGFLTGYALGLAGKPLPFAKKTPIAYSYNGTVLPGLPEWDRESYPYAGIFLMGDGSTYRLYCSASPMYGGASINYIRQPAIYYICDGNSWGEPTEQTTTVQSPAIWANHDVTYTEGGDSVYLSASDPIPIYE